jgi:ribonuclease PH
VSLTTKRTGRADNEMRPVTIETGVAPYAEGSALIAFGDTRVWCTASVEERVPSWLENSKRGWVTAEYSMLPRATNTRTSRERASGSGRSQEISRLIGRSLRAGIDLRGLGPRQVVIDCDVLQADGGTRTAAITGAHVALEMAFKHLVATRVLKASPLIARVAAVSAGMVSGSARLDLEYREDAAADVDCNVVMDSRGKLIEIQGSAEGQPFSREELDTMLDLAQSGISRLFELQIAALEA